MLERRTYFISRWTMSAADSPFADRSGPIPNYFAGSAADGDGAASAAGAGAVSTGAGASEVAAAGPGSATGAMCWTSDTLPAEQLEQDGAAAVTVPQPDWQWCTRGLTHFGFGQRTFATRTGSHLLQDLLTRALASLATKPKTMAKAATLIINFFNILLLPMCNH
jgi:hypothetical protein